MSKESSTSGGIGFTSLLLLAFIVLKLCRIIDWSWWWVMAPLWIPATLAAGALIGYLLISKWEDKKPAHRPPPGKSKWHIRLEEKQAEQRKRESL